MYHYEAGKLGFDTLFSNLSNGPSLIEADGIDGWHNYKIHLTNLDEIHAYKFISTPKFYELLIVFRSTYFLEIKNISGYFTAEINPEECSEVNTLYTMNDAEKFVKRDYSESSFVLDTFPTIDSLKKRALRKFFHRPKRRKNLQNRNNRHERMVRRKLEL